MKKIAIVSNNKEQPDNVKFVDSCDEVIRFSRCATMKQTGDKTTIWVTRTQYLHINAQYLHVNKMREATKNVHTVFITYGFPKYNSYGKIVGPEILPYPQRPFHDLHNKDKGIKYIPINARGITTIHPRYNPTNGLILLWHIINEQMFSDSEIHLIGFEFSDINIMHEPTWENKIIENWVNRGFFTKV